MGVKTSLMGDAWKTRKIRKLLTRYCSNFRSAAKPCIAGKREGDAADLPLEIQRLLYSESSSQKNPPRFQSRLSSLLGNRTMMYGGISILMPCLLLHIVESTNLGSACSVD